MEAVVGEGALKGIVVLAAPWDENWAVESAVVWSG